MSIINRILGKQDDEPEQTKTSERIEGTIIKLDDGWGFISSHAIPYTRIFFHWSALNQDTLHFTQLKKGMEVEFEPMEFPGKGLRAIKIKVIEGDIEDE
jgi:cold shock CspA family protein